MKAVRVHGPADVRIDEVPAPEAGPSDIVVRVAACGICGSDMTFVAAGGVAAPAVDPFGLGHELSGVIETVGAQVQDLTPGMRVIVNPMGDGNAIGAGVPEGAFAPRLRLGGAKLGGSVHLLPDHLSFETGALAEPMSVSLHAVNRADPKPGARVVVFGAGPIGLGVLIFLRRRGVEQVAVVDKSQARLARARQLGASATVNPDREDVAEALGRVFGVGEVFGWPVVNAQLFFEVSGAAPVMGAIVAMAPFHAQVVVVAVHHAPVPIDFQMALGKEMTFTTSMAYPDEFPAVIEALSEPDFDTEALVSHRFPLDRFMDAFAAAQDKESSAKVLVTFPV